jgi:hypothetical protein
LLIFIFSSFIRSSFNTPYLIFDISCFMFHMSYSIFHISYFMFHMSCVMCHISYSIFHVFKKCTTHEQYAFRQQEVS